MQRRTARRPRRSSLSSQLSGYRFIPKSNLSALLRSTFQIHNETGNIHSHLLGAIIILPLFWPSKGLDPDTTPMDRLVQTVYLVAALKCLVLSVSWHVMAGCADACWFERFACVDYTGIAWLVAASVWTLVYNGVSTESVLYGSTQLTRSTQFYCQPNLALFYSITTFLVGLMGATVPWAAWFNQRQNKGLRICVFLAMCFTGLAPFTHAAYEHGLLKTVLFFQPIVPSLLCYIGGLVFYAFQFPESIAPGRFDTWGHAHQIWHVSVLPVPRQTCRSYLPPAGHRRRDPAALPRRAHLPREPLRLQLRRDAVADAQHARLGTARGRRRPHGHLRPRRRRRPRARLAPRHRTPRQRRRRHGVEPPRRLDADVVAPSPSSLHCFPDRTYCHLPIQTRAFT